MKRLATILGFANLSKRAGRCQRRTSFALESLEGRSLMATLVADLVGVTGTFQANVYHYTDSTGWVPLGLGNVQSLVDTRSVYGGDELFARQYNGAIYAYTFSTGQWKFTGGFLDKMIADSDGISGTYAGVVYHYDDVNGFLDLGGANVVTLVDSHNKFGTEELFARVTGGGIYRFVYQTNTWNSLNFNLDQLIAFNNGIAGTGNGILYVYQDQTGLQSPGLAGYLPSVSSLIATKDPYGDNELVIEGTNNYSYIYDASSQNFKYSPVSSQPGLQVAISGGYASIARYSEFTSLYQLTPLLGQSLSYQSTSVGPINGQFPVSLVDAHEAYGAEDLFIQIDDGEVYKENLATGSLTSTHGTLDQGPYILGMNIAPFHPSFSGTFTDVYYKIGSSTITSPGLITGPVSLNFDSLLLSGTGQYTYMGTISISSPYPAGVFNFTEGFTATFSISSTSETFQIENLGFPNSGPDGIQFSFTFQFSPLTGLSVSDNFEGRSFFIVDNKTGYTDDIGLGVAADQNYTLTAQS